MHLFRCRNPSIKTMLGITKAKIGGLYKAPLRLFALQAWRAICAAVASSLSTPHSAFAWFLAESWLSYLRPLDRITNADYAIKGLLPQP